VWVNRDEIAAMADEIGAADIADFERQYIRKIGIRKSLTEFPNGDCVFYDEATRRCKVYAARPRQCRTWPFWDSNLRTPADWQRTCEECPGSGKGRTHQIAEINRQRARIRI
jgi:Fe-S-cluster containining protein